MSVAAGVIEGLYYELHRHEQDDARRVIILSSGLGGSAGFWTPQLEALKAEYTVLLYDHRGTGRSVRTLSHPHSVDAMADDILALMDELGLGTAHVAGHAAGGLAGLSLAARCPARVDRLAVINGWSRPDPHIARCFAARIALLEHVGPAAYVRAQPIFLYPATWISENNAKLDQEELHLIETFPAVEVMLARIRALLAFDIDDQLAAISTPTLISAAADDMLVPVSCSRRLADKLPNVTLDVMGWGGHAMSVTNVERFNRALTTFLGAGERKG